MIMWIVLVLAAVIAVPLLIERDRRTMDDAARGAGPGQFAELPQGVTHYAWAGPVKGPVIVCIHGLTTPSFVWGGLVRGLTALGYRVLTYDLYGRGYSDRPVGRQDAAFFLRQLVDLLTHQGVQGRLTLMGYSMGGAIATAFAADQPDRLRQLVLLAPAGMTHTPGPLVRFIRETPLVGDLLMLALYPRLHRRGIAAERDLPSSVLGIGDLQEAELDFRGFVPAVLASLRGVLASPLEAAHRRIAAKGIATLAIWGRTDAVIPLSALGIMAQWNRAATHEVIEGAGHGLPYTHTSEVLRLLETHLIRT